LSFTPAGGGGWTKFVGDALDAAETVSELIEAAKSALRLANGSGDLEDLVTLGITGAGLGAGGLPPGKGKGVDVNNRPILRGGSKGEIEKFRAEEFTADYLRSQGRIVEQNPLESSGRGNLGGDRIVDGVRTEFKRFKTLAIYCPTLPPPAMITWPKSSSDGRFRVLTDSCLNRRRSRLYIGALQEETMGVRIIVIIATVRISEYKSLSIELVSRPTRAKTKENSPI